MTAAAAAGAALIMGLRLGRDLAGTGLGVTSALGVALWLPNLLARPHVLTLPLAAAWTVGSSTRASGTRPRRSGLRC